MCTYGFASKLVETLFASGVGVSAVFGWKVNGSFSRVGLVENIPQQWTVFGAHYTVCSGQQWLREGPLENDHTSSQTS